MMVLAWRCSTCVVETEASGLQGHLQLPTSMRPASANLVLKTNRTNHWAREMAQWLEEQTGGREGQGLNPSAHAFHNFVFLQLHGIQTLGACVHTTTWICPYIEIKEIFTKLKINRQTKTRTGKNDSGGKGTWQQV